MRISSGSPPGDSVSVASDPHPTVGRDPIQRVVLVGFMGAGKSAVGRHLARLLRWRFIDVDQRVEQAAGMSIPRLFETQGEAAFRELEGRVAEQVLRGMHVVISTGGGWPVRDDRMAHLPPGTLSVWLVVDPATAVSRTTRRKGQRPLLETADPLATARALLADREPEYARAELHLPTGATPPEGLARAIFRHMGRTPAAVPAPLRNDNAPAD